MADADKIEFTRKSIRSLLISSKDGLTLRQLEGDHRLLMGMPIPSRELGFSNTAELLQAIPDVCRKLYNKSGEEVYKGLGDESTAHIVDMVSHQKGKKKKVKPTKFDTNSRRPRSNYSYYPSQRYLPAPSQKNAPRPSRPIRPVGNYSTGSSYSAGGSYSPRPSYNNRPANTQARPSAHPVHQPGRWPTGNIIENGQWPITNKPAESFNPASRGAQGTVPRPVLSLEVTINNNVPDADRQHTEAEIKDNIRTLLRQHSTGLWLRDIQDKYWMQFKAKLTPEYVECMLNWSDILQSETMHGRKILYPATEESRQAATTAKQLPASPEDTGDASEFKGEIQSPQTFYVGQRLNVYVAHVSDGMLIYVQDDGSEINTLMDELNAYYESTTLKKYKGIPKTCVCATQDSTFQAWTRAAVVNTDYHTKAELFYLDFGNSETKPLGDIVPLPTKLTRTAAQATPVTLFNVVSKDKRLLSKEFASITKGVQLRLVCHSIVNSNCSVVLYNIKEPNISINQKLVQLGLASWEEHGLLIPLFYGTTGPAKAPTAPASVSKAPAATNSTMNRVPVASSSPIESTAVGAQRKGSTASTASAVSLTEPSEAPLPDTEYWTVLVTHVLSPSMLFIRIKDDTFESFSEFQQEVTSNYKNEKPISLLEIGNIYIAHIIEEDGDSWHRVRTKELIDRNTVECEFVDLGSVGTADMRRMHTIGEKHRLVPFQARLCSLYGLDQDISDELIVDKLDKMTEDKSLIAQVITVEDGVPHIVLFDTTGEEDIEINEELGRMVTGSKLRPTFPEAEQTIDVILTYIERDGTFYVTKVGPAYLLLQELMNAINTYYTKQTTVLLKLKTTAQDFVTQPQVGDMVCAKYEKLWYRATIRVVLPDKKVLVYYGDYGNSSTLPTSQLRKIPADIEQATSLPLQALPCRLHGLADWSDEVGAEAAELIDSGEPYILKTVTTASSDQLTMVQLSQNSLDVNRHLLRVYKASLSDDNPGAAAAVPTNTAEQSSKTVGKPSNQLGTECLVQLDGRTPNVEYTITLLERNSLPCRVLKYLLIDSILLTRQLWQCLDYNRHSQLTELKSTNIYHKIVLN